MKKLIGKEIVSFDSRSVVVETVSNFWKSRGNTCILVIFIEGIFHFYDMIKFLISPSYEPKYLGVQLFFILISFTAVLLAGFAIANKN